LTRLANLAVGLFVCSVACSGLAFAQPRAFDGGAIAPTIVPTDHLTPRAKDFARQLWDTDTSPDQLSEQSQAVEGFLRDVLGAAWGSNELCRTIAGPNSMFVNLAGKGPELIAILNDSGRFCNLLVVVAKTENGVVVGQLGVSDVRDLPGVFYMRGRSTLLAIWQRWSAYEGARTCMAKWPFVYAFDAGRFTDVSSSVPDYYVKQLHDHENALTTERADIVPRDCLLMETEKLRRFVSPESDGERRLAQAWSRSTDQFRRMKAIDLFFDLDDKPARAALATLIADRNEEVAGYARLSFDRMRP
jgi:hypothetical protein